MIRSGSQASLASGASGQDIINNEDIEPGLKPSKFLQISPTVRVAVWLGCGPDGPCVFRWNAVSALAPRTKRFPQRFFSCQQDKKKELFDQDADLEGSRFWWGSCGGAKNAENKTKYGIPGKTPAYDFQLFSKSWGPYVYCNAGVLINAITRGLKKGRSLPPAEYLARCQAFRTLLIDVSTTCLEEQANDSRQRRFETPLEVYAVHLSCALDCQLNVVRSSSEPLGSNSEILKAHRLFAFSVDY